jgi:hypothetical protein
MERAERLDALDDDTFLLKLKEPFGLVLQASGDPRDRCQGRTPHDRITSGHRRLPPSAGLP